MNTPSPAAVPATAPLKRHRNLAQGVAAHLTDSIKGGAFTPGDKLPTESEIMRILSAQEASDTAGV